MKNNLYDRRRATALVPLLSSITSEIQERAAELEQLEARIEASEGRRASDGDLANLIAEAANHRRELRLAKEELVRLGCSIVGDSPMTIRIPGQRGDARRSFFFRSGDPVLK